MEKLQEAPLWIISSLIYVYLIDVIHTVNLYITAQITEWRVVASASRMVIDWEEVLGYFPGDENVLKNLSYTGVCIFKTHQIVHWRLWHFAICPWEKLRNEY